MARRRPRFLAALAGRAVEQALSDRGQAAELGRPRFLGEGLDYCAYVMDADLREEDGPETFLRLVARVGREPMSAEQKERARREVRLLNRLGREALPFRIPEVLGLVEFDDHWVMVQTACHGSALPARGATHTEPWLIIGLVAAAIHDLDIEAWSEDTVGPQRGRRAHVLARLDEVAEDAPPAFDVALGFVREHLPDDERGVLLHGDLLPQNILLDWMDEDPPAVLDWTFATQGDPAYDLAIVTRGTRLTFGIDTGRSRLLEAYNAASERPVTLLALRVHELLLRMRFHAQLRKRDATQAERDQEARFVQSLLRRAKKESR